MIFCVRICAGKSVLKPIERERIRDILVQLEEEIQSRHASADRAYQLGLLHLGSLLTRRENGAQEIAQLPPSLRAQLDGVPYVALCTNEIDGEEAERAAAGSCLLQAESQSVLIAPQEKEQAL